MKDGFHTAMSCPVLSALATADRRKAAPGINCGTLFFNGPNNVHLGYAGFTLNICFEYIYTIIRIYISIYIYAYTYTYICIFLSA